jgi:CRP/FNR family transcriptional regulator
MIDFFKKITIFSTLTNEQLLLIKNIAVLKSYEKNRTIFEDGERAKGFFIIFNGKVKVYKLSFEGKEQILHIFGKYNIFGEVPVFAGKSYPANATTLEKSELFFVPKDKFINVIDKAPEIALNMLSVLSLRLHAFTNVIENLSLKEVPGRLASFLLFQYEEKNSLKIKLSINKNQLASLLGTIPETLSRILNKFSHQNILTINGRYIEINDIDKLYDIADGIVKL